MHCACVQMFLSSIVFLLLSVTPSQTGGLSILAWPSQCASSSNVSDNRTRGAACKFNNRDTNTFNGSAARTIESSSTCHCPTNLWSDGSRCLASTTSEDLASGTSDRTERRIASFYHRAVWCDFSPSVLFASCADKAFNIVNQLLLCALAGASVLMFWFIRQRACRYTRVNCMDVTQHTFS